MEEITLEEERIVREVGIGPSFPGFPAWRGLEEENRLKKLTVAEPPAKERRRNT